MKRIIRAAAALVLTVSFYGAAQDTSRGSAKALFGPVPFPKATDNARDPHPPDAASNQTPSTRRDPVHHPAPAATGLKYWVELVQPGSEQVLRVNATRIFHSGERIRLHLQSNVQGRILFLQLNPNGTSQVLFPDRRVNHGDSHIEAGTDTAIPAANAWFTFDNHPAIERLIVFLEPDPEEQAGRNTADPPPTPPRHDPDAMQIAPGDEVDSHKTDTLVSVVERGKKSLILEVDDKSDAPAGYAVESSAVGRGKPGRETLAIEIQLKHQ